MTLQSIDQTAEMGAATRAAEANALFAADTFGRVLATSPAMVRLREAGAALRVDELAQAAIEAFNSRQAELRLELSFGTLDEAQRADLDRLESAMVAFPTVAAYLEAYEAFQGLCRETAGLVSGEIGIDFAANCRPGGCCGG